ncbi:MAG TPA: potassium-transporting ATPase subunit KdpC [Elusimicrobiales bacterium]|nr:potassium-transporting ATPase subunit KdpC [Elusimicrobiales bacterium]
MKTLITALKLFICMTVLTGFIYPLAVAGYALAVHPEKAKGSLVSREGKPIGSSLIAQKFTGAQYFHPRPSAVDYNPLPSGGSNLSPAGAALRAAAERRAGAEGVNTPDMLYASASGLDPHISPAAAAAQCGRVAAARGAAKVDIMSLVDAATETRQFGILGEPRVNALLLNLELDRKYPYERK